MGNTSIQTIIDTLRDQSCVIKPSEDKQFSIHSLGEVIPTTAADLAIAFTCIAADKDFHLNVDVEPRAIGAVC